MKVKQPLAKMYIVSDNKNTLNAINEYKELIKDEINVKEVEVTNNVETFNGTWFELQDCIKQMRRNGCYNITATAIGEE